MRAVIDIGSNSVLLLIGERQIDGSVEVFCDECCITRLSEGAGATGQFSEAAIGRTLKALAKYRDVCRSHGLIPRVFATEGLRMVSDPSQFLLPAQEQLETKVEVLSGMDEARLSYLSVAIETVSESSDDVLRVLDIGGGSTELTLGRGRLHESSLSHPIGSVRLTEALIHHDPPTSAELNALSQKVQSAFSLQTMSPFPTLYGLAGTVTTCAALILDLKQYDREQVDGSVLSFEQVVELRDRLAQESIEQRLKRACLEPGRADVIIAGATILIEAMRHCGADRLIVKDRGFRYACL